MDMKALVLHIPGQNLIREERWGNDKCYIMTGGIAHGPAKY